MKKTNPLIASFLILLFLNSCGTIAEGLGGSKKKGSIKKEAINRLIFFIYIFIIKEKFY